MQMLVSGRRWWLWAAGAVVAGAAQAAITIDHARFALPGQPEAEVALPDTWAQRGVAVPGIGRYRARFTLEAAPAEVWALRADRLSTHHELRVNGQLVHGTLAPDGQLRRPVPTLVTLPPALLRAGSNELELVIDSGVRAGLSPLLLGPEREVGSGFLWSHHRSITLPQMLNVASAGTALFMLLLWWLRRSEVTLGAFGALALLASLRNHAYFMVGSPVPPRVSDWLYFVAQTASVVLLGVFAMAFAGRRPRSYRGALLATALLLPPVSAWAAWAGHIQLARGWLYPWLLLLSLPSLALLLQAARQRRSAAEITLVVGLLVVLGAGLHDYLYQQGIVGVMDGYWMPYAVPVVMAIFSALLLQRLVQALAGVEQHATVLARRVAERTRELQAANGAKTRFLAAASHDLRQPMVSIGLLIGLLREQAASEPMQRIVQRLQEAAGAMEGLLKRLLDLSRLEAGTVRVHRQPVALQGVLDGIRAHHEEQALRQGLKLVVRPSAAVADTDPALLEQMLRNLVGNAVRYTQRGGVLVGVRRAGGGWRVEVWDTGPGIPDDERDTVFDEFVRGSAARGGEALSGMGLGLAIVQRSAALLGAPVKLRTRPGRGSCFSFELPAAQPAAPKSLPAENEALAPLAGRRVWLVEDNAGARASMQLLLEHWGLRVQAVGALGALHGLATRAAAPPDLLVTDQRLPDGRGSDAVAQLRTRWPGLPALLVTGDTAPEDLAALEGWRRAGLPVLQKPFAADALRGALQQALQQGSTATA